MCKVQFGHNLVKRLHLRINCPVILFLITFGVLLRTVCPTLYNLDSAELATGAVSLGIVHAPGYPLYLLVAHLFTLLPIGDVAFRVNLLSSVSLALAIPFLYCLINILIRNPWIAASTALSFAWSFYVWSTGVAAEARSNLALLSICGWIIAQLYLHRTLHRAILTGFVFGIAVAVNPQSILFAPGFIFTFYLLRIPWHMSLLAGFASLLPFMFALLYLPIRYAAHPALNMAGEYDANGLFQSVNLQTLQGIWWMLRGTQFSDLFFTQGVAPTLNQIAETINWFWGNYLGVGFVLGIIGACLLYRKHPKLFYCWLVFFVPYTYFFMTYGAGDRYSMFGPSYLLWAIVLAYGLQWMVVNFHLKNNQRLLILLPLTLLLTNFSRMDLSHDTSVRDISEELMSALPFNAQVFGGWWDIVPLQYLQIVEQWRPDVRLYNTFLFSKTNIALYLQQHIADDAHTKIVFLNSTFYLLDRWWCYKTEPLDQNAVLMKHSAGLVGGVMILSDSGQTNCD